MGGGGGGRKGAEWPKTENSEIASEFEPGTPNEYVLKLLAEVVGEHRMGAWAILLALERPL